MPRPEDIAWKFVVRLDGKRWRCPYCHKEYSGSVTRVKSHFLKQPKEGIAYCTKVPEYILTLMELLLNHEVRNKEDIAWKFVDRLEDNKWRCHYCSEEFFGDLTGVRGHLLKVPNEGISICREVPDHVRKLMLSLLDEVAEANSPLSMGALFSPGLEDIMEQLNSNQQDVIGSNSDQQSQAERQFHQRSTMPSQVQNSHVQPDLVPPQHQNVPHQSETRNVLQNPTAPSSTALMDMDLRILSSSQALNAPPQWPIENSNFNQQDNNGLNSGQQSQAERQFPQSSTMPSLAQNSHGESSMMALAEAELYRHDLPDQSQCYIQSQMQMNARQTPAGASSFQDDQLPAVDDLDCLQDCNQHSQLQTSMDKDPSIAPQHTSDTYIIEATTVDLQVLEVVTNTTDPSSSQDMNRGSPVMDVPSIYANDEEIRNLKRKVEDLDDREAVIKEQMEMESDASSVRKKPRILVERWLKETERARNNFQIIGQANAETLPRKQPVETLTREVEELIGKTLPQPLLIEERDVKGVRLLE